MIEISRNEYLYHIQCFEEHGGGYPQPPHQPWTDCMEQAANWKEHMIDEQHASSWVLPTDFPRSEVNIRADIDDAVYAYIVSCMLDPLTSVLHCAYEVSLLRNRLLAEAGLDRIIDYVPAPVPAPPHSNPAPTPVSGGGGFGG
jgi:hypothetical protein